MLLTWMHQIEAVTIDLNDVNMVQEEFIYYLRMKRASERVVHKNMTLCHRGLFNKTPGNVLL